MTNLMLSMIQSIPRVQDAAVYGADGLIASSFEGSCSAIPEVAAAARYLFRTASPAVDTLEVAFAKRRVLLIPVGELVVLLSAEGEMDLAVLRELVVRASEARGEASELASEASSASTVTLDDLIAAINAVTLEAKAHVGGAVIRNYMKKAQAELSTNTPALSGFSIDLQGRVSATDATHCDRELVRSAGAWVRLFIQKVSSIAPAISHVNLEALVADQRVALAAWQFFENE